MDKLIKILHLEDLPADAEIIRRVLKKGNLEFNLQLAQNKQEYENVLDDFCPDIILSDHSLPSFDSLGALTILKEKKLNIPFILITASMSEEFAVEIMKQGVDDYILKDRLQRLPNAVQSALEKKRIEAEHQKFLDELIVSEALLNETEHLANIGSFKTDLFTNKIKWSNQLYRILDYRPAETTPSLENFLKRIHPDDLPRISASYQNSIINLSSVQLDYRIITENGAVKFIHTEVSIKRDEQGQAIQLTGFTQDVTGKKEAEEKIMKAYRLYAFISQINHAIIHAHDEQDVFSQVCRIAIDTGGFEATWIGLVDTADKTICLVKECGVPSESIKSFTNVSYEGNIAKEYVVKTGNYYVCNDIESEPELGKPKSFATIQGFGSCMMLPIRKSGTIYGILNLYASEVNFFDLEEIKLLDEVADDISFALDNYETERQRKLAEEKLAHNEIILKEAQEIAHIGNWELDISTGVVKWSDEACRIYGIPLEENMQTYEFWLSIIHPEDVGAVIKIVEKTKTTSSNTSIYYRIIRKNGNIRYIHSQTRFQFNSDGKPIGIHGVTHDITDEKRAALTLRQKELHLRGILDSTDNGILAIDNTGKIINFNNRFVELWEIPLELMGEQDDMALMGKIVDQLVDPEEFVAKVKELYNSNETSMDILEFKNGKAFERYSTPLILNDSFAGRVWSFRDISERRKNLQAIEEQNEKLKEIAWIQSHLVRAPLSRILGLTDLMKNEESTIPDLLNHLFTSATELDDVIKSIVLKTYEVVKDGR